MMARVASALRIPSVIVELRIFEWREELESQGRPIRRIASQVPYLVSSRPASVHPHNSSASHAHASHVHLL